jgi:hypothetical protein
VVFSSLFSCGTRDTKRLDKNIFKKYSKHLGTRATTLNLHTALCLELGWLQCSVLGTPGLDLPRPTQLHYAIDAMRYHVARLAKMSSVNSSRFVCDRAQYVRIVRPST